MLRQAQHERFCSRVKTSRFARSDRFALRICGSAFLLLLLVSSFFALSVVPVWADRPSIVFSKGGRANLRSEDAVSSELIGRGEARFRPAKDPWQIVSFLELRRDMDHSTWSRMELGAEIGINPFFRVDSSRRWFLKPLSWMYVGSGIHQAWISPGNDGPELEIRTVFDIPLSCKVFSRPLGLYALNEYTYDLEDGRGVRNELGAGIRIPLSRSHFDAKLGWRHVDLIHTADIDQFEGSLQVAF